MFPSQPLDERPLLLFGKRLTSLASNPLSTASDAPCAPDLRILDSCAASGPCLSSCSPAPRSHGCSDSVSPCLNVPTPHSPPGLAVLVAGDLGGEIRRLPSALFTTSTGTSVSSSSA